MLQTKMLKVEFFELVRLLNRANFKVDQKTEILFFLEKTGHKLILYATTNKNSKLQLVIKEDGKKWHVCGFSKLNLFEKEMCKFLDRTEFESLDTLSLTQKIKLFIFQNLTEL